MNLRQRLDSLEQVLQPGRFLVVRLDPAGDRDEQLEAFRAENEVTACDTIVILRRFDFDDEDCQSLVLGEPEDHGCMPQPLSTQPNNQTPSSGLRRPVERQRHARPPQ